MIDPMFLEQGQEFLLKSLRAMVDRLVFDIRDNPVEQGIIDLQNQTSLRDLYLPLTGPGVEIETPGYFQFIPSGQTDPSRF
jgi:hypothetical protein